MSEPVSKSEIEDVLSSIRRLVSEDAAPVSFRSDDSTDRFLAESPPEDAGRLVLTPAFRVRETEAAQDVNFDAAQHLNGACALGDASSDDTISNASAHQPSEPAAPELSENTQSQSALHVVLPDTVSESTQLDQHTPDQQNAPEQNTSDDNAVTTQQDPEEVEVEPPLVLGRDLSISDAVETPDAPPDAPTDLSPEAMPASSSGENLNFSALADAPIAGFETASSPEEVPEIQELEARVTRMERAVDSQADEFEPDGSEPDQETPESVPDVAFASHRPSPTDASSANAEGAPNLDVDQGETPPEGGADSASNSAASEMEHVADTTQPDPQTGAATAPGADDHHDAQPAAQHAAATDRAADADMECQSNDAPDVSGAPHAAMSAPEAVSQEACARDQVGPDASAASQHIGSSEDGAVEATEPAEPREEGAVANADAPEDAVHAEVAGGGRETTAILEIVRDHVSEHGPELAEDAPTQAAHEAEWEDVSPADADLRASSENEADMLADDALADDPLAGLEDALDSRSGLDEDLLREIVSEVVRQELRGGLGEKITRNVRKMVRREIFRAFSAQDYDG